MDFYLICLLGLVLSFCSVFLIMIPYIDILKQHNINQEVSEYALDEYKAKAKTPIMGGLLFVILPICIFLILRFNALNNAEILIVLLSFFSYCLVGFLDDILIIIRKDNQGLSPKLKLFLEFIFISLILFIFKDSLSYQIYIPIIKISLTLDWYYFLPIIILMYLGEANAVNFTDGMDGLCAGVSLIGLIGFSVLLFLQKKYDLLILIICIIGGILAYLRYNHFPAKIFMGDSGSLALGALFSALALISDNEIILLVIGAIFLIEMFCVCLQLSCVKLFKKRIFSYTPIHYAFVLKGYKETKVVRGFYLAALIFTIIGVILGII